MASNKPTSFLRALQAKRPDLIFFVRGKDSSGHDAWYYISVDAAKREAFASRNNTPALNLNEYGTILHSGFGASPPDAIKSIMEKEYGFKE